MSGSRPGRTLVVVALVGLLGACSSGSEGRDWEWDKKAGAPDAAAFMKVDVPPGATEVKGAVKLVPQDAIRLLSFVTASETAEGIGRQFEAQQPLRVRPAQNPPPPDYPDFAHLGLPEPEALTDLRWAGVCPPCVEDTRRKHIEWIEIYLQKLDADRTRVYLRAW